jgi:hypothetical protein
MWTSEEILNIELKHPTGRLCSRWEPEFRKETEAVGALKTEKDRDTHRLESLNEKYEQNFEHVAFLSVLISGRYCSRTILTARKYTCAQNRARSVANCWPVISLKGCYVVGGCSWKEGNYFSVIFEVF